MPILRSIDLVIERTGAAACHAPPSPDTRLNSTPEQLSMGLRKAISLGFIQAAVSMAASFASVKVTSVYLGPAGIGILSQYQYIMSIVLGFAAGSTNTATVRLTAQYADDPAQYRLFLSTVSRSLLVAGIVVSISILIAAPWVAERLLEDRSWAPAIMLFGSRTLPGLVHSLLLAIANGAKDFRSVTLINISAVLVALVMFLVLCPMYGLAGALAAAGLTPLVSAGVALFWGRRRAWMPKHPLRGGFSREELATLSLIRSDDAWLLQSSLLRHRSGRETWSRLTRDGQSSDWFRASPGCRTCT